MEKIGEYLNVINDNMMLVISLLFIFGILIVNCVISIKFIIKIVSHLFKKKPIVNYEPQLNNFKPKLRDPYRP